LTAYHFQLEVNEGEKLLAECKMEVEINETLGRITLD